MCRFRMALSGMLNPKLKRIAHRIRGYVAAMRELDVSCENRLRALDSR